MNYKEFEKMVIGLYLKEIEFNARRWEVALDTMEKWMASQFNKKCE